MEPRQKFKRLKSLFPTVPQPFRVPSWFYWMLLGCLIVLIAGWVFHWGIQVSLDWTTLQQNPTDATKKKFDASLEIIKAIVSGVGTISTVVGGVFLYRNFKVASQNVVLTESRLITDRFSKAVEQLASEKLEVRLGGIYSLERIAHDSDRDHWTIMEVLTAFIQEKTSTKPIPEKPKDVQAALTVVGRRSYAKDPSGKQLDLSNLFLSDANLKDAHLDNTNLNGAHLNGAHLDNAHLNGAHLNGAHLDNAHLNGAHLNGAHLNGAYLNGAYLNGAHLNRAYLNGAHLKCADLEYAKLNDAHLKGADLKYAKFIGADLKGADLNGTDLSRADLRESILSPETQIDDKWKLVHQLVNRNEDNRNLGGVDLSDARLVGARLSDANLSGANLNGADLHSVNLSGTDLSSADLRRANLVWTGLRGSILSPETQIDNRWKLVYQLVNRDEDNRNLSGADLSGADLSGAYLKDACLKDAYLSHANLSRVNFGGADLSGAHLGDSIGLTEEQLKNVKLCKTILPDGMTLDPNRDCQALGIPVN
jgi:uncharacterized protein YjbI with pentapeptide repeats